MFKIRKSLMAGMAAVTLFSAVAASTPASAQWGWGPGWGGGWGGGWGYGGGWGGYGGGYGMGMAGAMVGAAAIGALAATAVTQSQYNNAYYRQPVYVAVPVPVRARRLGRLRTCYVTQWDSFEGYVQVAVPCR